MTEPTFETLVGENWVWPESLRSLATTLSIWVGYGFDESDWVAIEHGLRQTNWNESVWFSYPLLGEPPLELRVARSDGADPVGVTIMATEEPPERVSVQVETTLSIFNSHRLGD